MIVAHNHDYDTFKELLSESIQKLYDDSKNKTDYYLHQAGVNLEKDVYKFFNETAKKTVFEGNIELISGQRFPDIVAYVNSNKAYGIEVKTTKTNKWKSTGSSVFEGTRVDDVKNIHLLFGKLSNPIEFRCRKYEECLYDVAVTHSPRYLIDMDTKEDQTIFSKIGIEYDILRKLENPFKPIKKYFRKGLKEGEDIWWIDNNDESVRDLSVKHWGNLPQKRKQELKILALAYFPSLFGNNSKKYAKLATWLVSQFGIVNYALRDTFTAGGKIAINGIEFPQIFQHLANDLEKILDNIKNIDLDDISYYWGVDRPIDDHNIIPIWKKQCLLACQNSLNDTQLSMLNDILNGPTCLDSN